MDAELRELATAEVAGFGVRGGPRMYLIDRTALTYLSEICALYKESGSGGNAAEICPNAEPARAWSIVHLPPTRQAGRADGSLRLVWDLEWS